MPIPSASTLSQSAPVPGVEPGKTGWLLLGLGLATGMEFYTMDSMNLVLPDIVGALGVSFDEGSWILTVYSCTLFLGVPVSVWMAGHFGYKRYLVASILIFALASIGCATAPDLNVILFWRALQGFAGAGLYVWWRASIYLLLPKPQRSPSLMRVSTALYLSSAAGLLGGGYIIDHFSWRLILLPNLICAAAALMIVIRTFPHIEPATSHRLVKTDLLGIAMLALVLIPLQLILNRGQIDDWFESSFIQGMVWLSAAALILFIFWQFSSLNSAPLLRLELLRNRFVLSSVVIGVFTGMILSGSLYVLPEFLRNVSPQPHSASRTGEIMCVYAIMAALLRPLAVPMVARLGQRKTIMIALAMLVTSMFLFSRLLTLETPDSTYFLPLMLYACCLSPLLPAVGSGTVARIDQDKLLDGVSIYMTFRQLGAALGVSFLTILIERRETLHSARLFEHLQSAAEATRGWLATSETALAAGGGYSAIHAGKTAIKLLFEEGARQAVTLAYADAFLFMAAIGVLALCVVPVIPPTPVVPKK